MTKRQLKDAIAFRREKIAQLEYEIGRIAEPYLPDAPMFMAISPQHTVMWDCPESPFGLCAYHQVDDPAMDNCVFCGQPLERK